MMPALFWNLMHNYDFNIHNQLVSLAQVVCVTNALV